MKFFDLFVALDANDEQLDFAIVYAAAKNGYAKLDLNDESDNMEPLLKPYLNAFQHQVAQMTILYNFKFSL